MTSATPFEGWAILEVMGHRTRPGFVQEVEIAGGKMLRVDIPQPDGPISEFYGASSIYSIRPVEEAIAREAAERSYIGRPVRPMTYREPNEPAGIEFHVMREDEDDGIPI